jgi:hypothetical protein
MINAQPTMSSAAASTHGAASLSLELLEARRLRDSLKTLLRTEQGAMADFLVALADFDHRRGWEALGHANLFAFILAELGLSPAPTFWRQEAARLLQRFPDLENPLRQGQVCLSTMGELAKVLTEENREAVLPRFLGISTREAREIVAELKPRESPPMRAVVRLLVPARREEAGHALLPTPISAAAIGSATPAGQPARSAAKDTDPESLWTSKTPVAPPPRVEPRRDEVDPLTGELSRLSTTVTRRFLAKLKTARSGLSHAIPGATTEQVLEAALDLLLEKQARARGLVKKPRSAAATAAPSVTTPPSPASSKDRQNQARCQGQRQGQGQGQGQGRDRGRESAKPPVADSPRTLLAPSLDAAAPNHRRTGPREAIPSAVKRAVWERDEGRCSWPLDGGGVCGSTHRLELDHIHPWARDGEPTVANLRVICKAHNTLAARREFGVRCVERYRSGRRV